MIATGRPYRASQMYYHELNMSTPVVNFNGAFVHHPKANDFKVIHEVLDVKFLKYYYSTSTISYYKYHC